MNRREFTSVAAAAAAGFLLTACGPRRLREIPKDKLRKAIAPKPAPRPPARPGQSTGGKATHGN